MNWMFNHFWLLCGLWVGVIGGAFNYFALSKHVASGTISERERNSFVRGWVTAILIPCCVLWGFSLFREPFITADDELVGFTVGYPEATVFIICWVALLAWVWVGSGAATLSKVFGLISYGIPRFLLSVSGVRVLVTMMVVVSAASLWAMLSGWGANET